MPPQRPRPGDAAALAARRLAGAGVWLTLLAPVQRQHWAYATASGYVVSAAAVALLAPHVRHRGWGRSVV